MNLKEVKVMAQKYDETSKKTIKLIDEFIELYNIYIDLYYKKWSEWISKAIDEFKEIYGELEFELESDKKVYRNCNELDISMYEIATFKSFQFELYVGVKDDIKKVFKDIRFLQTKPESSKINKKIEPSIKEFRISIELNSHRDEVCISKFGYCNVSRLNEIKNKIIETNFQIESIENTYSIFAKYKSELEEKLKEIRDKKIIGMIEVDSNKVEVETLKDLIELL